MKIEKVTISGSNDLKNISVHTFSDTFGLDNTAENLSAYLDAAYNVEVLKKELNNPNSAFYFIRNDSYIMGYLKLNINEAQTESMGSNGLEIERIYIDKDFKRRGLGKRLFDFSLERAMDSGKKFIWLGVWEHNISALEFYKKMGFIKVGSHSFWMGKDKQTDYIMKKLSVK